MKIGVDIRKLRDFGIGAHIRNVILRAAALDPSQEYTFFCDPQDLPLQTGTAAWVAESTSKYSVLEHYSLARHARELKVELFHSPHFTLPLLWSGPSIVTIHDLIHLKFREYFPAWKVKAAELVIRKAITKSNVVLTVSETSKADILDLFPEAKGKLEVLYNRLDDEWFAPAPAYNLASFGIGSEYLLYVGNFKKHKGIETLVNAYSRLKNPPSLLLVGKLTEIDSDLNDRILAMPSIRLLGFADRALLQQLYARALLFVMPSLYEGFGYPPLEAMSCGTAVLSSDAPALLEVLGEGVEFFQRGNVDSLQSKLEMLLQQEGRRKELADSGPANARRYATDESPRKLVEIYRRFTR